MKYLLLTLLLASNFIFAQVGIGTTNPQETLHVIGSIRVSNTNISPATKMMGSDANGTMNEIVVGNNLEMESGTLNASGATKYLVETLTFSTTFSGEKFHNVNLDLNGANKGKTVFRIVGSSHGYEFTGISGGTDGRHIVLVNVSSNNFKLSDNDSGSLAQNRIDTMAGGFEQTSGKGVFELVYDAAIQKWIIVGFRN